VSGPTADLVARVFDAMNRRDVDAMSDLLTADAEWHSDPRLPGAEVHVGREAILAFLWDFLEQWQEYRLSAERVECRGDNVLVLANVHMRGMVSQVESDGKIAYLLTLRKGRIARGEALVHQDGARSAFEAMG
jgi:ketosteroid isomerase-like protein